MFDLKISVRHNDAQGQNSVRQNGHFVRHLRTYVRFWEHCIVRATITGFVDISVIMATVICMITGFCFAFCSVLFCFIFFTDGYCLVFCN